MYVSLYSKSKTNVEMLKKEPKCLTSREISNSVIDANMMARTWRRIGYRDFIHSIHDAKMQKSQSLSYGKYVDNIKTTVEAAMSFHRCLDMFYRKDHSSIQESMLAISESRALLYSSIAKSIADSYLNIATSYSLGAYEELFASYQESSLANVLSKPLGTSEERSFSSQLSNMHVPLVSHFASDDNLSHSLQESELSQRKSMHFDYEDISKSNQESEVVVAKASYVNASEISNSISENDLLIAKPRFVSVAEISKTLVNTKLDLNESFTLDSQIRSKSNNLVNLTSFKVLELGAQLISQTLSTSNISFDGIIIDDEWIIQNGSNLYIRQAWLSWKDKNNLNIDIPIWYEVEQNGSNLYIKQANTFWNDGDKGYVDTDIFYEPIQDGTNLYIRQAESLERSDD